MGLRHRYEYNKRIEMENRYSNIDERFVKRFNSMNMKKIKREIGIKEDKYDLNKREMKAIRNEIERRMRIMLDYRTYIDRDDEDWYNERGRDTDGEYD